jgi:lariat debranching enzyme
MRDLYFGGWVAPRIYYLGKAGSIFLQKGNQKVRVTGISGIYNDYNFKYSIKTEQIPLTGNSLISSYHVKQI